MLLNVGFIIICSVFHCKEYFSCFVLTSLFISYSHLVLSVRVLTSTVSNHCRRIFWRREQVRCEEWKEGEAGFKSSHRFECGQAVPQARVASTKRLRPVVFASVVRSRRRRRGMAQIRKRRRRIRTWKININIQYLQPYFARNVVKLKSNRNIWGCLPGCLEILDFIWC